MATKQINQLPAGASVTDTSFFADEDSANANVSQKLSALQIYAYLLTKLESAPLPLDAGGTGKALTAANGGLVYTDSNSMEILTPLTDGQIHIGQTGSAPAGAQITAGTGIQITSGAGSISISATGTGNVVFPIVSVSGTTKTLGLTDSETYQICENASNQTIQIPTNASVSFPISAEIYLYQKGAGVVSVVGAGGVTVLNPYSSQTILSQYSECKIKKIATNTWIFLPYSSELAQTHTLITNNFTIPNSPVMPPPRVWVLSSGNSNDITVTLPSNPYGGETHKFIVNNPTFNTTIQTSGIPRMYGNLLINAIGVMNVTAIANEASIHTDNNNDSYQVIELTLSNSNWITFYNIGFST